MEPACGEGHISEVLRRVGYEVISRDMADRGYGEVADFLAEENRWFNGNIASYQRVRRWRCVSSLPSLRVRHAKPCSGFNHHVVCGSAHQDLNAL